MNTLTDAQIYTLRRLNSGTEYVMRGDAKKADEKRMDGPYSTRPVNAPSIPVLYRHGLIEYVTPPKAGKKTSWHRVRLSATGKKMVKTLKPTAESI